MTKPERKVFPAIVRPVNGMSPSDGVYYDDADLDYAVKIYESKQRLHEGLGAVERDAKAAHERYVKALIARCQDQRATRIMREFEMGDN